MGESPASPPRAAPPAATLDELAALNREMAALVRSGLPLEEGLAQIAADFAGGTSRLASRLRDETAAGKSLAEAVAAQGDGLPPAYRAVVDAGLKSGRLAAAMEGFAETAARVAELRRIAAQAAMYPLLVCILAWVMLLVVLVIVVPQFDWLDIQDKIWATPLRVSSEAALALGVAVPAALAALAVAWWFHTARPGVATTGASLAGWIPGVRRVRQLSGEANFADLLRLMVTCRLPLDESLRLAGAASGWEPLRQSAAQISDSLAAGRPLASIAAVRCLPPMVRAALLTAPSPESLAAALERAVHAYRGRAASWIDYLAVVMPVAATLLLGGAVAAAYAVLVIQPYVVALEEVAGWHQPRSAMSDQTRKIESAPPVATGNGEWVAAGARAKPPLDEVFLALAEEADDRRLRRVARGLADRLHRGEDLQAALRATQAGLPPFLRRALAAGTPDEQIVSILQGVARHESSRRRLRRQMQSVLLYPAIVLGLLLAILAGGAIFVVPYFELIFEDFDLPAPVMTRMLFGLASGAPVVLIGVLAALVLYLAFVLSPGGQRLVHWIRTGTPFLGRLWIWDGHHEFASVLGALVSQKVALSEAMQWTASSLRDRNLARAASIAADKCHRGSSLSRSLVESLHFEPALTGLVGWGEANSALPTALDEAAHGYAETVELHAAFLRRVLPPVLFIAVIATVFFFVSALMIPLIDLMRSLSSSAAVAPGSTQSQGLLESLGASSVALLLMGVCLHISMRLLYGARGPAIDDSLYLFMRILGWGLLLVPSAVLLVAGANGLSILLLAAILEAGFELILGRREVQRQAAWRLAVESLAGGRSTIDSLQFHEARFSGLVGRRYRRLLADLERGVAWQQALWANRRAFPREAPAIAGMLQLGARGADAGRLDSWRDAAFLTVRQQIVRRFLYLTIICLFLAGVLTFVTLRIIPSFQQIFADFHLELPPLTATLIASTEFLETYVLAPFVALASLLLIGMIVVGLTYLCDWPLTRMATDWLTIAYHRAQVLRLLSMAFEHGKSVDASLAQLESGWAAYPSALVRRRIGAARERAAAGQPWQDAMQGASLLSASETAVLRAAQQAGNLPWAMRMLADRQVQLTAFRWTMIQQVAFTLLTLAMGLLVAWIAAALICPLAYVVVNLSQ